jgi:hypothetical protein
VTAKITSALERSLREDAAIDRVGVVNFMLDLGEAVLPQDADGDEVSDEEAAMWSREVRRDIAGTLSYAASKEVLGEDESLRALRLLETLLRDPDPTEESEARDAENGYDPGMLALNSVRGEATTAAIELLLESRRTDRSTLADATAAMLRHALVSDQSRSVRAAIGIRLPWVLIREGVDRPPLRRCGPEHRTGRRLGCLPALLAVLLKRSGQAGSPVRPRRQNVGAAARGRNRSPAPDG